VDLYARTLKYHKVQASKGAKCKHFPVVGLTNVQLHDSSKFLGGKVDLLVRRKRANVQNYGNVP